MEWHYLDDGNRLSISKQHYENLRVSNEINCLILGGSNSMFSLSAEQMSSISNLKCYNLSLLNEGFSDQAYFNFIREAPIDKKNITHIFYSTIFPLSSKDFYERMEHNVNETTLSGNLSIKFKGPSIASYFARWLKNDVMFKTVQYPAPSSSGDFNFDEYGCNSINIQDSWTIEAVDISLDLWVRGQLAKIRNIFSNSKIYFIVPSTLRENFNEKDTYKFSIALEKIIVEESASFIEQSPFKNRSVLCDGTHHANSIGRELRTRELMTLFKGIK